MNFNLLDFDHYKQYILCLDSCIDRIGDTEVHPYIQLLHVKSKVGFKEAKKIVEVCYYTKINICGLLFTIPKNYKACSKPTMDMSSKGGYALV